MELRWLVAYLDTPRSSPDVEPFWQRVTGTTLSSRRGEFDEYATLIPPDGDPFVHVQLVGDGEPRCHLDLHVHDVREALGRATELGAALVTDHGTWAVCASPGGFAFCLGPDRGSHVRPAPVAWPDGQHSLLDQLCLDIPARLYERETQFWSAFTGWEKRPGSLPEFEYLARPADMPLRLLLQKLDDAEPVQPVRAHVDFACDDVAIEAQRHMELGATFVRRRSWITLRDPAGREYCVTSRSPFTGAMP